MGTIQTTLLLTTSWITGSVRSCWPLRQSSLADAFVGAQIQLLVFDAAPQPLDEHVVPPSALAIHADRNAVAAEDASEGLAGELRALIRVEDVGRAVTR